MSGPHFLRRPPEALSLKENTALAEMLDNLEAIKGKQMRSLVETSVQIKMAHGHLSEIVPFACAFVEHMMEDHPSVCGNVMHFGPQIHTGLRAALINTLNAFAATFGEHKGLHVTEGLSNEARCKLLDEVSREAEIIVEAVERQIDGVNEQRAKKAGG